MIKGFWRRMATFWGALILAVAATRVYWNGNFPYTHDGASHLARFANYAAALREGQLPPRFAPYLNSGFGFPVFNYNYPLANILSLPLIWLDLNPERVFSLLATGFLAVGIAATYLGLRRYFPRGPSVFGCVLYSFSAYLAVNLVFRGGIGELMAYALTPLAFLTFDFWRRSGRKNDWLLAVIALAALFLSHNVLAIMSGGLLGAWSLSWVVETRRWRPWLAWWLAALGLGLWFWLPALWELPLIALTGDALAKEAFRHTLTLQQLLFSPWQFGFSRPGPLDTLGFGLGPAWILLLLAALVIGAGKLHSLTQVRAASHAQRAKILAAIFIAGSLFLTLDISRPLWERLSFLSLFQFPWRWLFVFTLVGVPLGAWIYRRASGGARWLLWLALGWQIGAILALRPADRFHYERDYYLSFPHTTTTRNENRPETFTWSILPSWAPYPSVASGEAAIKVNSWLGSRRQYEVQVAQDAVITEPTVYFPGWVVRDEQGNGYPIIITDQTKGLVAYQLSARAEPYRIESAFSGRTKARLIGELLSIGTLIGLAAYWRWRQ